MSRFKQKGEKEDCDDCDALKVIHQIAGQYSKEKDSEKDPAGSKNKQHNKENEKQKSQRQQQQEESSFWEPADPPDIIELGLYFLIFLHIFWCVKCYTSSFLVYLFLSFILD
jgi:hypothetical protein